MPRYVIVGGVAGGATAAARLRRRDEAAEIVILERGEYVSYANCGLPYHIGGVIEDREALLVSTPAKLVGEFNIDVRVRHEVTRIDRAARAVQVRDLAADSSYSLTYDALVLSPGAAPVVPAIPGAPLEGVLTLRTIPDMDAIEARLADASVKEALIVGGGFIGLEMAENLAVRGLGVTLVEMLPQVMAALDPEMAALLHRTLREHIRLGLSLALKEIQRDDAGRLRAVLSNGEAISTDMVLLCIGVRPESTLARDAGLEIGPRGHIVVNEYMQTSDPLIYAAGDVVQVRNPLTGVVGAVPLAGPANRQARVAASHITGQPYPYSGAIGTAIVRLFDVTAGCTGANSVALQRAGIPYLSTITHTSDHLAYYPGATRQTIKLLYSPIDGKILGAQALGANAIDRTIDTLATAVKAGSSVYDLEELELVYSPQYGGAKSPVNIAGYVAANRLRGDTEYVEWQEIAGIDATTTGILDVMTTPERTLGHIPGSVHIPMDDLRTRMSELDPTKSWIVYCSVGRRGYGAERLLRHHGYRVTNLSGGYVIWSAASERQDNWDTWTPKIGAPAAVAPSDDRKETAAMSEGEHFTLSCAGMQCPGPILSVYQRMREMQPGDVLEVTATDRGFRRDIGAWCEQTGNTLLSVDEQGGYIRAVVSKGTPRSTSAGSTPSRAKTMIVFSGDLDHALAAFIIANGAAAAGQPMSMFFTFWGLNILRRDQRVVVRKTLVERMFGWMMPRGANALKLSRLNMAGLGTAMMKGVMKSKNIDALPALIQSAREAGVRLIACQMTMEMMGIKAEELLDGVEIGGVATMLNEVDKGNAVFFV